MSTVVTRSKSGPAIHRGVEDHVGNVKRSKHHGPVIAIELTNPERVFLAHGLRDISRTIEAILHHPQLGSMVSPWSRTQVRDHVMTMRNILNGGALTVLIINPLQKSIIAYAIESNDYFSRMADNDHRLTPEQVKAAHRLREKVARAIGRRIAPVWLGVGRERLADPPR